MKTLLVLQNFPLYFPGGVFPGRKRTLSTGNPPPRPGIIYRNDQITHYRIIFFECAFQNKFALFLLIL